MPRQQITLEEVIDAGVFAALAGIYKVMPGIVRAYYAAQPGIAPATVDVAPAVNDVRIDLDSGDRVSVTFGVLPKVPVGSLRFGPFVVAGPLQPGSKVLLVSPDLDPTIHRATGNVEDPALVSRHKGTQWVALPLDITDGGALQDPGQSLTLGAPAGVQVAITSAAVNLGAQHPTDAVALASRLDTLHGLLKAFALAMGAVPPTGPLAPLAAAVAAAQGLANGIPATVASQTVKCQP